MSDSVPPPEHHYHPAPIRFIIPGSGVLEACLTLSVDGEDKQTESFELPIVGYESTTYGIYPLVVFSDGAGVTNSLQWYGSEVRRMRLRYCAKNPEVAEDSVKIDTGTPRIIPSRTR